MLCNHLQNVVATTYIFRLQLSTFIFYNKQEDGSFSWPRTPEEAMQLTREQYEMLMMGLNPVRPKIREVNPQKVF